jgi:pimeloyl-ACP methyl ester carboxylesterase
VSAEPRLEVRSFRGGRFEIPIQWAGRGRPLLYLHDAWGQLGEWRPGSHLARLAERFLVLAPSHPGYHGATGEEALEGSLDLALYYLDFLDEMQIESPHVVGHGLGGLVAAEMASLAPREIAKLVLVAPLGVSLDGLSGADIFALDGAELTEALWVDSTAVDNLLADATVHERRAECLRAARRYLPTDGGRGLRRRLHRLLAPTLLVWGERDGVVGPELGERWRGELALARLVILPDAAHVPQIEQSGAYSEVVLDFLRD